jgi:hypothetical protein
MVNDPIVEEIRKFRDEHAARFNYDLDAIFDDIKRSERELGLPLVTLPPNRVPRPADTPDQPADRAA